MPRLFALFFASLLLGCPGSDDDDSSAPADDDTTAGDDDTTAGDDDTTPGDDDTSVGDDDSAVGDDDDDVQSGVIGVEFTDVVSTGGSTRGTAYAMSNKIITRGGGVFAAWLDHESEVRMVRYDAAAGTFGAVEHIGTGTDNHGGPAVTLDSGGHLHVVFGPHHGPFQYRSTSVPLDITAWSDIETFGDSATYPSLVCDAADTLHLTYRGGDSPNGLLYQQRPSGGDWSDPVRIVDADVAPGYTQFGNPLAVAADGTLHLGFHIYDEDPSPGAGKALGYLRSPDGGTTWESVDGVAVPLPATPDTDCFVEQDDALDMRIGDLVLDPDGDPWLVAIHLEEPQHVQLWTHDGSGWLSYDPTPTFEAAFPDWVLCGGTMTFDEGGVLYLLATTAEAGAETWFGDPSHEIVLLTSLNGGQAWQVQQVSTTDATTSNWLPSIGRPFGPDSISVPSFLYTHGNKGDSLPTDDPTEIVFGRLVRE